MAETRVVVTADAAQAVQEFARLRTEATASVNQIGAAGTQLGRTGVSAAQTAAALRQVPAQLTDIVVGLQSGQAPLTVLLQQGGQLKDMFGGVVPAARALGTYVAGLATPTTVLAGAVGVLAYAYYQGSKEASAYTKALIMSGNAAGVTKDQLGDMARDIGHVVGTQGQAAEALAALAATGKVGAENIKQFAMVAVQAQKVLGITAAETASQFAELAKSPLQATEKLNEKFHYLTGAVYLQIKALQDRGRADEAGEVAQKAYATALADRATKMTENLGLAERAWAGITGAAKSAWDAMLNVGREDTLEEKLKKVQEKIRRGQQSFDPSVGGNSVDRMNLKKNEKEAEGLKTQIEQKARIAAIDAGREKFNQDELEWTKQVTANLSRRQQLENELAANTARGLAAGRSDKEISDEALKIRQKYSDIYNDSINSQIEGIKRTGEIQDVVAARSMAGLTAIRAAGLDSSLQAKEQYAEASAQFDLAEISRHRSQLEEELALTKKKLNSEKDQATIRGQLAKLDEDAVSRRLALTNELYVLDVNSTRAAANAYADLYDKRLDDLNALQKQVQAQADSNAVIGKSKQEVVAFNRGLVEEAATRLENQAAIIALNESRKDEAEVLRKSAAAMRQLADAQTEGALKTASFELAKRQWESLDQTAHNVFVDIFNGGKSTFDRLRDTLKSGLLDLLYQMTIKKWIFQVGAQVSGFSGLNPAAQAVGFANSGGNGAMQAIGAAGNVYGIASGSAYTSIGNGLASAGNFFGSSTLAEFGSGFSGASSADALAATLAGDTIPALSSAASAGASLASALSTAVPYIAAAAVAYKVFDSLLSDGPESDTRLTFASNNRAGAISINERGNEGKSDSYIAGASTNSSFGTFGVSSTFWAPAESETVQNFVKTVGMADDALAKYLTTTEKASVTTYLTGKTDTAHVGAEGQIGSAEAGAALSKVFTARLLNILEGVEPGLSKLEEGFSGTSAEMASEVQNLLAYRAALRDSGEAVFGVKLTLNDIAALKQPTEAVSAALGRVTAEFNVTNQVMQALGRDTGAFGAVGLASESARAQLIMYAGGADKLSAQIADFAQNFLSDSERIAPLAKQLDAELANLGLSSIPQSKEQFKELAASINVSTEAGQKQLAGLLALEGVFAQVHASERAAADIASERADLQKQLNELTMTSTQLLEQQRNAIDASNRALYDQVQAAQAAKAAQEAQKTAGQGLLDNVSAAYSQLQAAAQKQQDSLNSAYQTAADALQQNLDRVSTSASKLESLSQALHSTIDSISVPGQERQERQSAQAQIDAALAIAKAGGPLPDAETLRGALSVVSKDASGQFASYLDYQRDLYRTKNSVSELAKYTDSQLTADQQMLKTLQAQKDQLDQNHREDLAKLTQMLDQGKAQVDALNGINTAVTSIPQAIAALAQAISAAMNNPVAAAASNAQSAYQQYLGRQATTGELDYWKNQAANGVNVVGSIAGSNEAKIQDLYRSLLGRTGEAAGVKAWENAIAAGQTWDQIKQGFVNSDEYKALHPPGFAGGGDHAGGIRLVGEEGPELEVTGPSRIFNAGQTKAMLGSANSELLAEVRAMRAELAQLRAAAARTADSSETSVGLWKRVIRNDRLYASTKEEAAA